MNILIVAPSELEANFYLPYLQKTKKLNLPFNAYEGLIGEFNIVLAQTGIGKIKAAINTWQILQNYNIKQVLVVGVAGISPLIGQVGDICLGKYVFNSDLGYLFDNSKREKLTIEIPNLVFKSDLELINKFKQFGENFSWPPLSSEAQEYNKLYNKHNLHGRLIETVCASGDCFFHGFESAKWPETQAQNLINELYGFTEMESAAVLEVCQSFNVPALIIKIASNFDRPWNNGVSETLSLKTGLKFIVQMAQREAEFITSYFLNY